MFPGNVDGCFFAFQLGPSRAIHFSKKDSVLTWFDPEKISSRSIESHGRSRVAEKQSRTPAIADSVEIDGDRGGEIIGSSFIEEDLFSGAENVHGVFGGSAQLQPLVDELVELGVSEVAVVGVQIGFVGKGEHGGFFSRWSGLGEVRSNGFSQKGAPITGPLEGLDEDVPLPARFTASFGMKDVPPLGAIG